MSRRWSPAMLGALVVLVIFCLLQVGVEWGTDEDSLTLKYFVDSERTTDIDILQRVEELGLGGLVCDRGIWEHDWAKELIKYSNRSQLRCVTFEDAENSIRDGETPVRVAVASTDISNHRISFGQIRRNLALYDARVVLLLGDERCTFPPSDELELFVEHPGAFQKLRRTYNNFLFWHVFRLSSGLEALQALLLWKPPVPVRPHLPLILRQYACGTKPTSRRRIVPLAYMTGMFRDDGRTSFEIARQQLAHADVPRPYHWAFVGHVHPKNKYFRSRQEAVDVFSLWKPHAPLQIPRNGSSLGSASGGVKTSDIPGIYTKANFVLSGRGHANMDCFRNTEASIVGTIPIIAIGKEEFERDFQIYPRPRIDRSASVWTTPPWIRAETWPEALKVAKQMDDAAIVQKRKACLTWWIHVMSDLRRRIVDYQDP